MERAIRPTHTSTASLARWRERAPRCLIGGAWFFIVFSLLHLVWVVAAKWGDPAGLTTLYQTSVMTAAGEETHRALGLAYDGVPGLLLALVQAGAVGAAAVFSTSANRRRRRIGHAILVAWAGLWMGDMLHLASIDHHPVSFAQATLMTGLFACTLYRAVTPRRRPSEPTILPPINEPEDVAALQSADVPAAPHAAAAPEEPAPPTKLERAKAAGARTAGGARRVAARVRERGAPLASAGAQRVRSGARRFAGWLRAKGVIPATTGRGG